MLHRLTGTLCASALPLTQRFSGFESKRRIQPCRRMGSVTKGWGILCPIAKWCFVLLGFKCLQTQRQQGSAGHS